jgi:hypothetical protein
VDRLPAPPILVRGDELFVFFDVATLRRDIEVHDVLRRPWRAYDRDGRVFEVRAPIGKPPGASMVDLVDTRRVSLDELDELVRGYLEDLNLALPADRADRFAACVARASATT